MCVQDTHRGEIPCWNEYNSFESNSKLSGHIKYSGTSGCPSLLFFLCLFSRSTDNDDATKRKVNLVFEKIQTLKSRAAGSTQGNHQVS